METQKTGGTNIADFFQTKPTRQSDKVYLPTLESSLDCNCPTHSSSSPESYCSKCKEKYPQCCLKIFNMCLICRSRSHDPVNIIQKPLTQVFFDIKQSIKMSQIIKFVFNLDKTLKDGYGIEVRCFKPWKQMIQFPMLGTLYINEKLMTTLKPLIKCSNQSYRRDVSFFIDKQYLQSVNNLKIHIPQCLPEYFQRFQCDPKDQPYFLGIYIVKCQTYNELLQNLSLNSSITTEQSINKFLNNQDIELANQKLTVKLQCPYSSSLVKVPARGGHCQHFVVFCLQTLYNIYAQKRKWDCPICGLHLHDIIIDKWLVAALKQNKNPNNFSITFFNTGKWEWKEQQSNSDYSDDQLSQKQKQKQIEEPKKPVVSLAARKTVAPLIKPQPNIISKQKIKQKSISVDNPPSKNKPSIIVLDDDQPPILIQKKPHLKQQKKQPKQPRQQKPKAYKPQKKPNYQQLIIPIIDCQVLTKERANKMLKQLCSQFDKLNIQPKKKTKTYADEFKKLFKLN